MIAEIIAFIGDKVSRLMGTIVAGTQWILDFIFPSGSLYGVDASKVLEFIIPVAALVPIVFLAPILERIRPIENYDTPEARATIVCCHVCGRTELRLQFPVSREWICVSWLAPV
jgi:hypothetical protein